MLVVDASIALRASGIEMASPSSATRIWSLRRLCGRRRDRCSTSLYGAQRYAQTPSAETVGDFAGNAVAERGADSLADLEDTLVQLAARIVGTAGRRSG